jgi:addiction module HigA family antidote
MPMKNPPHPGLSIRHDCLEPLGLSVTDAATHLGVSRKHLSDVVNGHSGISPEMAVRLATRHSVVALLPGTSCRRHMISRR